MMVPWFDDTVLGTGTHLGFTLVIDSASNATRMACLHCGSQSMVETSDLDRAASCTNCGMPISVAAEDLPEQTLQALELHQYRDVGGFRTGAACGAMCFGVAMTAFNFLPVVREFYGWDTFDLVAQSVFDVAMWMIVGAILGGIALKVLSAILTPSWVAFRRAIRGMIIGFAIGATFGAGFVFIQHGVLGGQSLDFVWVVHSDQVTFVSILAGSCFAVMGSWVGAVTAGRLGARRQVTARRSAPAPNRFQFSLARLLILTTSVAIIIGVPAQVLMRLRTIDQLAPFMLPMQVMVVASALMLLPFAVWATMRGPAAYAGLVEALTRWRNLEPSDHKLRKWASREE